MELKSKMNKFGVEKWESKRHFHCRSRESGVEYIFLQSKSGVGSRKYFFTVEVGSRPPPDSKSRLPLSTPRSLASLDIWPKTADFPYSKW